MQIVCKRKLPAIITKDINVAKLEKNYFVSIYLDTRRQKISGKYPVKLRVYHATNPPKQKLYNTRYEFTEHEFATIMEKKRLIKEQSDNKRRLSALVDEAYKIAENLPVFNFDDFERLLFNKSGKSQITVNYYYEKAIEQYIKNNQLGTSANYRRSLQSLLTFAEKDYLAFETITPQWLRDYEDFMINKLERSATTVGFYVRPLRAIFNTAIHDKTIPAEIYPFGKRKYIIPSPKKVKKALLKIQLKLLWETKPSTPDQQKAKDYWFFLFFCNGINPKDMLHIQNKDVTEDKITFKRAKTARTNKAQTAVTVFLNEHVVAILQKYRTKDSDRNAYVFPILDEKSSAEEKYCKTQNFIRFINQHFIKFANSIGINERVSCQWARHSFATTSIRGGFSMEMISEALGHTSSKTTQTYFAGFEDEKKKEIAQKLMEF